MGLRYAPDYVAFSDQDDVWYKDKLLLSLEFLKTCPALSLVHCDMDIPQSPGRLELSQKSGWEVERRDLTRCSPEDFAIRNIVAGCGSLMDADLCRRYPQIPIEFEFHDHWFASVASCFGGVYPIFSRLYFYRLHSKNVAGITEYRSFFNLGRERSLLNIPLSLVQKHLTTRGRSLAMTRELNFQWSSLQKLEFSLCRDAGLVYFFNFLSLIVSGKSALARANFARAIGKFIFTISVAGRLLPGCKSISKVQLD